MIKYNVFKKVIFLLLLAFSIYSKTYMHYINKYAKQYKIRPELIKAIYKKESDLKTNVMRFEKKLKNKKWYNNLLTEKEKKNNDNFSSVGISQILFGTAKSFGFKGTVYELKELDNNTKYSVMYLRFLIDLYYKLDDVLSSYNGGHPLKKRSDKKYRNQYYINKIKKYYRSYLKQNKKEGKNK